MRFVPLRMPSVTSPERGIRLGLREGTHYIDITIQDRERRTEFVRGDQDELQLVAVQLAQNLVGLLQVCDHLLIVGADAVQGDADEIDRHAWASAEDGLEIPFLHFQHGAFGGRANGGGTGCALDERHLPDYIPSASHAQDPFFLAIDDLLGDDDLPVRDDIEHILIGPFMA